MKAHRMDHQVINALKGLVIDGVHRAQSGHPGGAMSSMDLAYILFSEYLNFDPKDPQWLGRDRFILSAGHESMLLYALLYACGWLKESDLAAFRQLHSLTPGHPESTETKGVECTTGPLGQGAAMSVGFAAAAKHLCAKISKDLFFHHTWVLLGDGCMQEDITYGAASLAGHWGLNQLVWIYDKNKAQISGSIQRVTSDDEKKIYEGFGWQVLTIDGHNHEEIREAYSKALASVDKPTLIIAHTVMAKGAATTEGSHKTHGSPFKAEERLATKQKLELPVDKDFFWDGARREHFQSHFPAKSAKASSWRDTLTSKLKDGAFQRLWSQHFSSSVSTSHLPDIDWDCSKPLATRSAFGKILSLWEPFLPQLVGGSADLEPSNMTEAFAKQVKDFSRQTPEGRNFAFGVREFPMSAIANGLALHGGLLPFDATFLTFSDYSKPALRLAAIQKLCIIHEFTHDSFYLGEDGPTHQPVEHLMSLRLIPDSYTIRPADALETEVLFKKALTFKSPSSFCLSRQDLRFIASDRQSYEKALKGAWFVRGSEDAKGVIYATGSELGLALDLAEALESADGSCGKWPKGSVAVVSVPCWELFFEQEASYIKKLMIDGCAFRISIEAGSTLGWERFVGRMGLMIGLDRFGASGAPKDLEKYFGFTVEDILKKVAAHAFI